MLAWQRYFQVEQEIMNRVLETQGENIMKAAEILADTTQRGGIIYGYGVGHSHLICDDAFWRAATPANYCALLEHSATGNTEITKSAMVENLYGIGSAIVDYNRLTPEDCLIVISNAGNLIAPVEAALRAKEKGIPVIGIACVAYANYLPRLHKDGWNLIDIADVVIDNCSLIGDAAVEIEGMETKVGSTSTVPGVLIQTAMLTQMVEILCERGFIPDVYYNGHLARVDEKYAQHNDRIVDKYFYRIRNL